MNNLLLHWKIQKIMFTITLVEVIHGLQVQK